MKYIEFDVKSSGYSGNLVLTNFQLKLSVLLNMSLMKI